MALQPRENAILALSDGTIVYGFSVGYKGITGGELCFNTSMTGYQELVLIIVDLLIFILPFLKEFLF